MKVYLVYGAPCSGKTTWVLDRAKPEDLIIDVDKICAGISCNKLYDKPGSILKTALGIRDYLLGVIKAGGYTAGDIYVIGGYPNRMTRSKLIRELNAKEVFIHADIDTCLSRAKGDEQYPQAIAKWFDIYNATNRYNYTSEENRFYHSREWTKLRKEVLELDHYECQRCKAQGKYAKATTVHHVKPLREYPELATSIWNGEQRQLISLCSECHNSVHPEKQARSMPKKEINLERW